MVLIEEEEEELLGIFGAGWIEAVDLLWLHYAKFTSRPIYQIWDDSLDWLAKPSRHENLYQNQPISGDLITVASNISFELYTFFISPEMINYINYKRTTGNKNTQLICSADFWSRLHAPGAFGWKEVFETCLN